MTIEITCTKEQGRRQLREIGGGKDFRRNAKAFSGRNRKFSDQKQVISKKKSSPKSEGFCWPKSQIPTFFPPKSTNLKKYRGGQGKNWGAKTKIGGDIAPPAPPLATRLQKNIKVLGENSTTKHTQNYLIHEF